MANADQLPIFARLHTLRDTLRQLVAELHIVAERAELFAAPRRSRPRLMPSGTPQLETHREHLARLHEQARIALDRGGDPVAANLFELLTAADERPPRPVLGAAYTFAAVLEVVRVVRAVGWGGGGRLRDARDPWERMTPAERLSRREMWEWGGVPLPHFGDPTVVAEFNASLKREFDRAERAAGAGVDTAGRTGGRRDWAGREFGLATAPAVGTRTPPRDRHKASPAVKEQVLGVFAPGDVLCRQDVRERMRAKDTELSASHTGHILIELHKERRLVRVRHGWYRLP